MAKYIRIKKSKNLRFRLISILYLLFISLSIIQIPIGWLRVNPNLRTTLLSFDSESKQGDNIEGLKSRIKTMESEFMAFAGSDPLTGDLLNPENYAQTDQFFLEGKKGEELFLALQALDDSVNQLPEDNPTRIAYLKLFQSDLDHGLEAKSHQSWTSWKFSHVPATVVQLQMADLLLKLNLLQGDLKVEPAGNGDSPELVLAYNIDELHIGDTAYFVYEGEVRPNLELTVGKGKAQNYDWEKDSLVFVALDTGSYKLEFQLGREQRSFQFEVLPGNFSSKSYNAPEAYYSGLPFYLPLENWQSQLDYSCTCMPGRTIHAQGNKLRVQPSRAGWCYIKGMDPKLQALAFEDSVYIHPLPAPLVYASGISRNQISRTRLVQKPEIDLKVLFPGQDEAPQLDIKEVRAKLYGSFGEKTVSSPNKLILEATDVKGLSYIEIEEVLIQSPDGEMKISDRLIINVITHEK
ncbi:hypothetical protein [Croceimicrobium sp.]|uniref:hypothetical protein n=1 Tax=Croceimicrobium sp. TaxID=2828340 RepID=UPI003BAA6C3A